MTLEKITGNTYPVKDALKAIGCRWNADEKCWVASTPEMADKARAIVNAGAPAGSGHTHAEKKPFRRFKCVACGRQPSGRYGDILYRSGECRDCYEERKMGY